MEPAVALAALEHWTYCPRQCGLVDVEGQWLDNRHTVRGTAAHRRADSGRHRQERGRLVMRSLPLWSDHHGLAGRADTVEFDNGAIVPVEYKAGVPHGDAANIQLTGQALCLEEMFGVDVPVGFVWYGGPRRRVKVAIDEALRTSTLHAIDTIRTMLRTGNIPEPVNDARCTQCQMLPRCLPDVVDDTARLAAEFDALAGDYGGVAG